MESLWHSWLHKQVQILMKWNLFGKKPTQLFSFVSWKKIENKDRPLPFPFMVSFLLGGSFSCIQTTINYFQPMLQCELTCSVFNWYQLNQGLGNRVGLQVRVRKEKIPLFKCNIVSWVLEKAWPVRAEETENTMFSSCAAAAHAAMQRTSGWFLHSSLTILSKGIPLHSSVSGKETK